MKTFIAGEEEYRKLHGKHAPITKEAVQEEYSEILVCDCEAQTVLVEDPEPMVNAAADVYYYKCVSCNQRFLFVLSSRELVRGQ